jgi:hypothetical protein
MVGMIKETESKTQRQRRVIIAKRRRFARIAAPPNLADHHDLVLVFFADVRERLHPIVFDDLWRKCADISLDRVNCRLIIPVPAAER